MTSTKPPTTLPTDEYEAIESALLESARGRWFLSEFTRRNRTADTQVLLDAISRLENSLQIPRAAPNADVIRRDLIEMSEAISRTRREIAAIKPQDEEDSQLITATEELDAIVLATEKATSDILQAAEEIQETAWVLRESNMQEDVCDKLDQRATDIYMACSFQDITGQRTEKVVKALRYLESRVNSMIEIWGLGEADGSAQPVETDQRPDAHLLNGPQLGDAGLDQEVIDDMISSVDDIIDITPDEPAMSSAGTGLVVGEIIEIEAEEPGADDIAFSLEADSPRDEAAVLGPPGPGSDCDEMQVMAAQAPDFPEETDVPDEPGAAMSVDASPEAPVATVAPEIPEEEPDLMAHEDNEPPAAPECAIEQRPGVMDDAIDDPPSGPSGLNDLDWDKRVALFS